MKRPWILPMMSIAALALGAGPAAAGGFGDLVNVYSSAEEDVSKAVTDVATGDDNVYITFSRTQVDEQGDVIDREFGIAVSHDDGATFPNENVEEDLADTLTPRVEHCPTVGVVIAGVVDEGSPRVVGIITGQDDAVQVPPLFKSDQASRPDVACAGDRRIAVAYLSTIDGSTLLALQTYRSDLSEDSSHGFYVDVANKSSTPTIAAVGNRIYVAWVKGKKLRLARLSVGSGPDHDVTSMGPAVVIDTASGLRNPRLAASGDRVLLAWERGADVVARMSTNKGMTFGSRRVVEDGSASQLKVGVLTGVDVSGPVAIVSSVMSSEGISFTGRIRRTTNNGGTWSMVPGSKRPGFWVTGALSGAGNDLLVHLVEDQRHLTDQTSIYHSRSQ